ncbi:MAG: type III-B CRISPR module RAMP protein Cmr4 [Verrucomicrobiae bacterium]|nr:type III-B CRISPR module RAMP protein Cmr4 [Verrucomicrobiae bacterium]
MTDKRILYIFTRTPLHVGAGASVGAIDQPIIRERHTGFPVIPGTSIKGVLRDVCRQDPRFADREKAIFGEQDEAGRITFGEAKIIAFPVRSAKGSFAFITCPLALERLRRELSHVPTQEPDKRPVVPTLPPIEPAEMQCLAGDSVTIKRDSRTGVILEEYRFNRPPDPSGKFPNEWQDLLLSLMDDPVWALAKGRLVLLNEGDFAHFVRNACEVSQHVKIDPRTGTAQGGFLFNNEAVPAETLFFLPITPLARAKGEMSDLTRLLESKPVLQFGGDGTTGLGFCSVRLA